MSAVEIETPRGTARAHLHPAEGAKAALVLGHGAGGQRRRPRPVGGDRGRGGAGVTVALVEQPYRVAGRKSSPPPAHLDEAWIPVIEHLAANELPAWT